LIVSLPAGQFERFKILTKGDCIDFQVRLLEENKKKAKTVGSFGGLRI